MQAVTNWLCWDLTDNDQRQTRDVSERIISQSHQGSVLLDQVHPGWEFKVNLNLLEMSSAKCCVLGQLFGDFLTGAKTLRLDCSDLRSVLGFLPEGYYEVQQSNAAWVAEIQSRRLKTA
jgi:hypothetical protein